MRFKWDSEIKQVGMDGLANAAMETFVGVNLLNGLVRELVQNAQDAKIDNDEPVKIKIRLFEIDKEQIPFFDEEWLPRYQCIYTKWKDKYPGFFKKTNDSLKRDKLRVFEFSNFNCEGLKGDDDDDSSSFNACVLSEGNSVSESTSGGSYGIGKNAIFNISNTRTVLYSSKSVDGEVIFMGISKLAQYEYKNKRYSSRIILGDENFNSVRDKNNIPEAFKREKPGLSQYAICADFDENTRDKIVDSVFFNYFKQLKDKKLEVEIIDEIHEDNKEPYFVEYENEIKYWQENIDKDITPKAKIDLPMIFSLEGKRHEKSLTNWKGKKLDKAMVVYVNEKDIGKNRVAYLRRGMKIKDYKFRSSGKLKFVSLSGIFFSENNQVNEILRAMEPATHDNWDIERLPRLIADSDKLKWARGLLDQIDKYIKDVFHEYVKNSNEEQHLIEEVDEMLKIGNNPSTVLGAGFKRSGESDEAETALKTGKAYEVSLSLGDIDETFIEGEFIDKPKKSSKKKEGNDSNKEGSGERSKQSSKTKIIKFKSAIQQKTIDGGKYRILLESNELTTANISITQSGDRGSAVPIEIISISQNGKAINYNYSGNKAMIYDVIFTDKKADIMIEIKGLSKAGFIIKNFN